MKKYFTLVLLLVFAASLLHAQGNVDQISTGTGYTKFCYYKLSDGATQQVPNEAWDLAFSNLGVQQAGVFVNESTSSSMGQTQPGVEAYFTGATDFSVAIDQSELTPENRVYNPEISWAEGAFNTVKDENDPLDFGWGSYNPQTFQVQGTRVFALKLRNGQYRKVQFLSYDGQNYQFKTANLDGSNLQNWSVAKSAGNGSPIVYFSFSNTTPTTPVNWDLVFHRYFTWLYDGTTYIPYAVTGVLHNDGIQVAQANGVDPFLVDYNDYIDSLQSQIDVIGHDWKYFSGSAWSIEADRVYFAKQASGALYQLYFFDFEGSSTGTATLERTYLTQLSAAEDLPAGILDVAVFPNPTVDHVNVAFTAKEAAPVQLFLFDMNGKLAWQGADRVQSGLNVLEVRELGALPSGNYQLLVRTLQGQFARPLVIGKTN